MFDLPTYIPFYYSKLVWVRFFGLVQAGYRQVLSNLNKMLLMHATSGSEVGHHEVCIRIILIPPS